MDASLSEIPLQWAEGSEHHLRSQTTLGYARTRLRQVNLVNAEVIPQDLTPPQQATLTIDKKTSDTTSMAEKPEQEKGPAQPPHNVIIQLAPNNALIGTAEIIFFGHKISSEGVGPDPGNVKAMKKISMPQNVSQLRSLLGALSYYGTATPQDGRSNTTAQSLL